MKNRVLAIVCLSLLVALSTAQQGVTQTEPKVLPYPILFAGQVPIAADYLTVASVFGNHDAQIDSVPRGGDLFIRYPDGTLKNLTRLAGFGQEGMQGATAIAVREPSMHWSGTKAIFSMVIGAPQRYQWNEYYWQMYEITGLGKSDTPVITKVPNQPERYNNVSPIYGTDDRIIFSTDRPRNGARHLYPQLDEYEEAPTTTGLWSLDPASGDLRMLNHSPSGVFTPSIDSYGRLLFTRWDHLQRDQQADTDAVDGDTYGTFDYADESANAARSAQRSEIFPEPRSSRDDLLEGTNLEGHEINHFFPWEMNEDGTAEETLNHVGRHELHSYFNRSFNDDPDLDEFIDEISGRANTKDVLNVLQMREDPLRPGVYYATDAPEFYTHGSGQIIRLISPHGRPADDIEVEWVTPASTRTIAYYEEAPADHSGHYRDPLPLSDGSLLVVHTWETRADENDGIQGQPRSRYGFRIRTIRQLLTGYATADQALTGGIQRTVSWYNPDNLVTWQGELWELSPVEVRPRQRPQRRSTPLEEPEARVFREEGVDPAAFSADLARRGLAAIVSRDVTSRDELDRQQPFNLSVAGSSVEKRATAGRQYAISHLQLFQADQVRGMGGVDSPRPGRRVLARLLKDAPIASAGGPPSSVTIASDGSVAALVPARRALTWQLTDPAGAAVVRERYWLTFQPGEVRVCSSCHGVNSRDQLGQAAPQNPPEALRALLRTWKAETPGTRRRPLSR